MQSSGLLMAGGGAVLIVHPAGNINFTAADCLWSGNTAETLNATVVPSQAQALVAAQAALHNGGGALRIDALDQLVTALINNVWLDNSADASNSTVDPSSGISEAGGGAAYLSADASTIATLAGNRWVGNTFVGLNSSAYIDVNGGGALHVRGLNSLTVNAMSEDASDNLVVGSQSANAYITQAGGGAMLFWTNGSTLADTAVTMSQSTFTDNTARVSNRATYVHVGGGALSVIGFVTSSTLIANCTFVNNALDSVDNQLVFHAGGGGAVAAFAVFGSVSFAARNSTWLGNTVSVLSAAVAAESNCGGGALYINSHFVTTASLNNTYFEANSLVVPRLEVTDSAFTGGGAVYVIGRLGGSFVNITGSVWRANTLMLNASLSATASSGGGGMYVSTGGLVEVSVWSSQFVSNLVAIAECHASANSSSGGGGLYLSGNVRRAGEDLYVLVLTASA
jgi:hypothetical protein